MSPTPWYGAGLRFACTQCGRCCTDHDDHAFVYLDEDEARALARHLGLSPAAFRQRYTTRDAGDLVLKDRGRRCILLGDDNRCRAYPARPRQCRTWPFWPENLARQAWHGAVKDLCPGIGQGRLHARAEIEALAEETGAEAKEPPGPRDG